MNYLFPHYLKIPGLIVLILGLILSVFMFIGFEEPAFFDITYPDWVSVGPFGPQELFRKVVDNIFNEIIGVCITVGGILFAFSKEKNEDEFIHKIRLDALIWSMYVNYGIVLFGILVFYLDHFFTFMIVNLFTVLLVFVIKFRWSLYKANRIVNHEE